MKILVTGSASHLAAALLPMLCARPEIERVTGVDLDPPRFQHTRFNPLRLDIRNYEPKQWCGPLGCNPIRMPDGETHHYRFHGPNMLVLQLVSGGQAVQYQRAQ